MSKYPPKNPRLSNIPGVTLLHRPGEIYEWKAFANNGWVLIAKAPWKKLCWKQAQRYMAQMG